jgi:PhzF family phenazine biosynthesis protein
MSSTPSSRRIIDAFTDQPFRGNPAAVCLLNAGGWPNEGWMQDLAREMNLSETAFARPLPESPSADWGLRWFTPVVEDNLCGHATLAVAHALFRDRRESGAVRFDTRGGVLTARARADGGITLDFPAAPANAVAVPDGLSQALGARADGAFETGALGDLLVVFPEESAVRELSPDFTVLADLTQGHHIRGIIATAASSNGTAGYDFVSRFFSPADGIPEDPVTGSAHTALAPFWSARIGRDKLTGLQASARAGLVHTELQGDRVLLTGYAVTVLDGSLGPLTLPIPG